MGNSKSKPNARCSSSSNSPLKIDSSDSHNPTRMSVQRSPGLNNLASYDPKQTRSGVHEIIVTSFAGDEPDDVHGDATITHPKPARPLIRRYSELLDPTQLETHQVRSPSGQLLSGSTYALRDDRPLSVRERQEKIKQQIAMQRQYSASYGQPLETIAEPVTKKEKRGCLGCFRG